MSRPCCRVSHGHEMMGQCRAATLFTKCIMLNLPPHFSFGVVDVPTSSRSADHLGALNGVKPGAVEVQHDTVGGVTMAALRRRRHRSHRAYTWSFSAASVADCCTSAASRTSSGQRSNVSILVCATTPALTSNPRTQIHARQFTREFVPEAAFAKLVTMLFCLCIDWHHGCASSRSRQEVCVVSGRTWTTGGPNAS